MHNPVLIRDVTSIKAFEPAIKLQSISADLQDRHFRDYILSQELADVYAKILSSVVGEGWGGAATTLPAERRHSHLISAQYGAGKSYFLMILSALLGAAGDVVRLENARQKFGSFRDVQALLRRMEDKRFLILQISAEDKGDIRFKELLVRSLLSEVRKLLPDVVFANEYNQAISHVEQMESLPTGPALVQTLQEKYNLTPQQLLAQLGRYDRDGLRAYYQAMESVTGRPVSRDILELDTTFKEALELVRRKGYTHIAVLIDELTAYLNASGRYHSLADTLNELMAFAAFCNNPASHCLLVGTMHVEVQEFLQGVAQQRDFEKVKGRFDLLDFPIYSNRLLAGVFEPNELAFEQATHSYRGQLSELARLTEALKISDDGRPMHVSSFFPLHPAVVYYLPRISRELGQAERTTFGFISDIVRPMLDEPLGTAGQLNLVTLDQVFDYFQPAIEQRPYYQQIIAAYNAVQAKVESRLAHRAFKPLVMLWVSSRVRTTEAGTLETDLTAEQVAEYIGYPDANAVAEALDALRAKGYVYLDRSTQRYFYSHADAGWDLEEEIQKQMVNVDPNEVLLSELAGLGPSISLQVPEKLTVKVERSLESQWLDVRKLQEVTGLAPKRAEGKVVFIVPDLADVERYPAIWSDVSQKARRLSAANVAIAVPKRVDMLNHAELRRFRALSLIGGRLAAMDEASVSQHRVRVTRARFDEVRQRLQRDLEAFGQASNFLFFVNGHPLEAQDAKTIWEDMFEGYFYKFPKVRAQSINGRSTTNALIDGCIVNQQATFSGDTSEVARQTRDTLQVLGLCTWEELGGGKFKAELREPKPGDEGYELWKLVVDTLTQDPGTPFETLYRKLAQAPYGVPSYLVELYIAAAMALKQVFVLDSSNRMPAVSRTLVAEVTKYKDNRFRVLPVERSEVPYTYVCSVWQVIDEVLKVRYYQELEKSLGRSVDDQRIWIALKQDCNNLRQNWLPKVLDNLGAIGASSASLVILVRHLDQVRKVIVPAQGYKELADLGQELSGKDLTADPDAAAQAVRRTIEAASQLLSEWEGLYAAYRQFSKLSETELQRFGEAARSTITAWQQYSEDALSAERRHQFIVRFEALWAQYAEEYVREHNTVARSRADSGKDIEQSPDLRLVAAFSELGFRDVATGSTLCDQLGQLRKPTCRLLSLDAVLDYRKFDATPCSSCSYRLGSLAEVLQRLQQQEQTLQTRVANALASYLGKTAELLGSESLQLYLREQATPEEKATLNGLTELTRQGEPLRADQEQRLLTLVPRLKTIVPTARAYADEQAKRRRDLQRQLEEEERRKSIPRLPTATLAESVRSFLLDSGLEAMTLDELNARVKDWVERIGRELTPKA